MMKEVKLDDRHNGIHGNFNAAFDASGDFLQSSNNLARDVTVELNTQTPPATTDDTKERPTWGNGMEFLMSCIMLSVGIGNIWRFPFTAYENGGGAFVFPYLLVLVVIGRPMYYLEMSLGQFMSQGPVKIWKMAPLMKGIGFAQLFALLCIVSYYAVLLALTLAYLVSSFSAELPWAVCKPEWGELCIPSVVKGKPPIDPDNLTDAQVENLTSSSELYFLKDILHEKESIDDGIGWPDLKLTFYLFISWAVAFLIMVKGVKSSGKASYFLALFPYAVMLILLVRSVTLDGAWEGISYLLTPRWEKLLEPVVWRRAVEQCFFSLSVGLGPVVMFSSYNQFNHNIYKDAYVVAVLDTFTSLLAGVTIFGILGNLALNLDKPVEHVVKSGTGLAFISYPDAIAKFDWYPQGFAVLFFFMLFVLGIGSCVGLTQAAVTSIWDHFPNQKYWKFSLGGCIIGFLTGVMYVTPGGQWMLTLVDAYGGTFLVLGLAIFEMVTIMWIYGLDEVCTDIEFMSKRRLGWYWRLCWGAVTPICMICLFILALYSFTAPEYSRKEIPMQYHVFGWSLFFVGIVQIPIWFVYEMQHRAHGKEFFETLADGLNPSKKWGPQNLNIKLEWVKYKKEASERRQKRYEGADVPFYRRWKDSLFGVN